MTMDEPSWGKYAIEILHSRERAEERYQWWEERARSIPGAEVRVWHSKNPLGGESFMLMTRTLELMPEEWRRQRNDRVRQRIAEMQRSGPVENRDAVELAAHVMGMPSSGAPQYTVESLEERLKRIEEKLQRLRTNPDKP